ncbi:DsbA family protein [Algihabitans albus]|uniref:DsbA family protein n=1 Tax=Algihabitans albus TaxID=2164067 RepID=UPI0013C36F91|nr:thioredoxin domain-containing protein [Algihabitans albus]
MNRRQILQLGGGLTVLAGASAGGLIGIRPTRAQETDPLAIGTDERVLGERDAPATLVDYSSLTCPHCARFHTETLPQIKTEWVDSGRARVVYRHFPLDRLALTAAMAAECIERDQAYFAYLDMLFAEQTAWARAEDPLQELQKRAQLAGLSPDRFNECIQDEAVANRILEAVVVARDQLQVSSTPTLFAGTQKIAGAADYETFDAALREAAGQA